MIADSELIESISIMCDRLQSILKCLSNMELDKNDEKVMQNLAEEIAYNIKSETNSIFC